MRACACGRVRVLEEQRDETTRCQRAALAPWKITETSTVPAASASGSGSGSVTWRA